MAIRNTGKSVNRKVSVSKSRTTHSRDVSCKWCELDFLVLKGVGFKLSCKTSSTIANLWDLFFRELNIFAKCSGPFFSKKAISLWLCRKQNVSHF